MIITQLSNEKKSLKSLSLADIKELLNKKFLTGNKTNQYDAMPCFYSINPSAFSVLFSSVESSFNEIFQKTFFTLGKYLT